jgi:CubicO group peptidase (beta-lactamase class C family)
VTNAVRIPVFTSRFWVALLAPLMFLAACESSPNAPQDSYLYQYQVPEATLDGWPTASLVEVGLREAPFASLMEELHRLGEHEVHSILVAKEGKLVFEEYFPGLTFSLARYTGGTGFDRDDTHNLASVTKSFTTTLVGIAIDRGYIDSVEEPVFDFFPEHGDLVEEDPRREAMTLEDLLSMMSGILWNDLGTYSYEDPRNDLIQMFNSQDPIRFALSKDLYFPPGTFFDYCNANTNILGEIVSRAVGQRLDAFARDALFTPLGISQAQWQMLPNDVVFASGDLRLRPRDMAKFGELFLRMGSWGGEEVVSRGWIEVATDRHVDISDIGGGADAYGYGWWHWDLYSGGKVYRSYQASGWGGQWIVVIPEEDLVVVSTGGNYFRAELMPLQIMLTQYILSALEG